MSLIYQWQLPQPKLSSFNQNTRRQKCKENPINFCCSFSIENIDFVIFATTLSESKIPFNALQFIHQRVIRIIIKQKL